MRKKLLLLFGLLLILIVSVQGQSRFKTVNYLNSIKGKYIMSGQHNDQKTRYNGTATNENYWTNMVYQITGKYPALYSGDFLFNGDGPARWAITYEAERQWNAGAAVNMMWHTCPPVQGDVCGWDGGVKSSLTASQWSELLTNGTALNNTWKSRIDEISVYLQYLENKGVEVLWRPMHEQNQTVFWWNSGGAGNTKALWKLTHDYMTNTKGLSNLIWVWDLQDMSGNYADWNPGAGYFDVAAVDYYGDGHTNTSYYNSLQTQAGTKPVAVGETFKVPTQAEFNAQPNMSFFMVWAYGLVEDYNSPPQQTNSNAEIQACYNNPRVITRDEMPGWGNVNAPLNLATAKPVTVSSTESGPNIAANAVDGSYTTRWSSAYSDAEWMTVDLGAVYDVNRVKISWEAAYGKDYRITGSVDGTTWFTLKTVTGNTSLTNDYTGLTGTCRYISMNGSARGTVYGYSIYEFEVYGNPAATNQLPTVSLTSPSNNSTANAPATITMNANAADSDGSISKVEFFNGTTLLGTATSSPYSYTWTNVAAGTYIISAKATDNSGGVQYSTSATVTVNTVITTSQTNVVAYFPTYSNFPNQINSIDLAKLTHLNIAFANPNSSGTLVVDGANNSDVVTVVNAAHAKNVKVLMAIGGGGAPASYYQNAFSSSTNMTNFVNSCVNYATTYNLDGIDVDIEGDVLNGSSVTSAQYQSFVTQLGAALHAKNKIMTAALADWFGGYVTNTAAAQFDFIGVMAYDQHIPGTGDQPGSVGDYQFAVDSYNYWRNKGVPSAKINIGVPFYGYGWGTYTGSSGGDSYASIVAKYPGAENSDMVGSGANAVYYNGIPTIKQKTAFAIQNGAGIMIWEITQDATGSKSLLTAINQVVGNTTTSVPTNLATGKPVTVSSTEVGVNVAANAVDGSYATRWSSLYTDAEWLTVDLGASYNVNRVKITWEAAYGKDYTVQFSTDATTWSTAKSIAGNTSLVNDHTGLTGSARYVRMNGTARGTVYGYSIYELEVYGSLAVPTNLATDKPVTVSSTEVGANVAANAVDGSYATRWSSAYTDAEWLTVDLGASYNVNRVKITWEAAYGKDYRITGSVDGTTWTTLKTVSGNTTLTNDLTGITGTCRYISMNGTARGTVYGYSIYELEVYGTLATTVNQAPTVSLTSPVNNSNVTAPASLLISANAADSDGSVVKVEFFNGTILLNSDVSSPYSYTWTNVAAGTYTIKAKATDNSGAVTYSSAIVVTVSNTTTDACSSIAQYVENGGYTAGSKVKNNGRQYQCKPYPYSGWCNGAAWAYGPGTGSYWSDAWLDNGSCTGRTADSQVQDDATTMEEILFLSPNPASDYVTINYSTPTKVRVLNAQGTEVITETEVDANGKLQLTELASGIYYIRIDTGNGLVTQPIVKR